MPYTHPWSSTHRLRPPGTLQNQSRTARFEIGRCGGVENRCIYNFHLPPLTSFGRRRVKDNILAEEALPAAHVCVQPDYLRQLSELLRRGRARDR